MPCACSEEVCRSGSISKNHQLTNLNKCGKFHACIRNGTILALSRLAKQLFALYFHLHRLEQTFSTNEIVLNYENAIQITVELPWLELVGTVGASSTHPCVRVIPSLSIFKLVHVYFMSLRTPHFLLTKGAKRT